MEGQEHIRVVVVDDSAVIRKFLEERLSEDPAIDVVATAVDPFAARRKIVDLKPDVASLDTLAAGKVFGSMPISKAYVVMELVFA